MTFGSIVLRSAVGLVGVAVWSHPIPLVAVVIATIATLAVGTIGLRVARTTSDFFVASRSVGPVLNASAICGEYLSAASFLGIAGLITKWGVDMLWYPVGYTAGYLVMLLLVAAPLRRFGAYTISDFAEGRLDSVAARRVTTGFVLLICTAYLVPQMKGAGVTLQTITGLPYWVGVVVVAGVVTANVAMGGMRGVTFVQAFQYWLKLTAIAVPAMVLLAHHRFRHPTVPPKPPGYWDTWSVPLKSIGRIHPHPVFSLYSLILATFLGTMGLPHILVRFHTNSDGKAARRTTLLVLGLVSTFYLFPMVFGALGRLYAPDLVLSRTTDRVVLQLPSRLFGGLMGEVLTALVACGAFAAFLSTASGLAVSVAGAVSQDLLSGSTRDFRWGAVVAGTVSGTIGLFLRGFDINQLVVWTFALAASTFCPLLLLGIWWRRLTVNGALAGMLVGGLLATFGVAASIAGWFQSGWPETLLAQPAAWSVPLAFATMIVVSLTTPNRIPPNVRGKMRLMHVPESLGLSRSA
jgi:cation/acetate symporter